MSDPALASLIREVLGEELAKLKAGLPASSGAKESVRIANDADLNAFARKFLARMNDPAARRDFEEGRLEFTLGDGNAATPPVTPQQTTGPEHRIDKGFVSERHIDKLPDGIIRLLVGKAVRLTPLARDRARQRGIIIERIEP
jgi:hypothetical protein